MKWRTHRSFLIGVIEASLARQALGAVDPRLVLGWMIGQHGEELATLEAGKIDASVRAAAAAVNAAPKLSEQIAEEAGV